MRHPWLSTVAGVLALSACGSEGDCDPTPEPESCADLDFRGVLYDEWQPVDAPAPIVMQELGNATYPACNAAATCEGDELIGFGSTDVWLVEGVDVTDAVLGRREGTTTTVIFVRVGVDPEGLRSKVEPGLLD